MYDYERVKVYRRLHHLVPAPVPVLLVLAIQGHRAQWVRRVPKGFQVLPGHKAHRGQ